jgi:hypothetical protein
MKRPDAQGVRAGHRAVPSWLYTSGGLTPDRLSQASGTAQPERAFIQLTET